MKIVNYSRLNVKNKARIDATVSAFSVKPTMVHHSVTSTGCTKFVRSIVTVSNPAAELNLILGDGRLKQTQIALDK